MRMLSILTFFAWTASAVAGDWPQFRGPDGLAISTEENIPVLWSKTEGIRWAVTLPGRGAASPVVVGDRVYVTASSGVKQDTLHTLCLDLKTGKLLWHRRLFATGLTACHPKSSMAAPTPVADADGVYVLFATADLAAYDKEGNLRWYRSLNGDYPTISNQVGMASSPILVGDTLVIPMDNSGDSFLAGIDTRYGTNRWKITRPREINWTTPVLRKLSDREEILFLDRTALTSYDAKSGAKLWTYRNQGLSSIPSPVVVGSKVLAMGRPAVLIDPMDTAKAPVWNASQLGSPYSTPIYFDGKLFNIAGQGVLAAVDATTGKVLYQERLKGPYSASPVIANGKLYAVNEAGITHVVDITGPQPKTLAVNDLSEPKPKTEEQAKESNGEPTNDFLATPAIANGTILLRSDSKLYCIGSK